jgi:hypothetical protein
LRESGRRRRFFCDVQGEVEGDTDKGEELPEAALNKSIVSSAAAASGDSMLLFGLERRSGRIILTVNYCERAEALLARRRWKRTVDNQQKSLNTRSCAMHVT